MPGLITPILVAAALLFASSAVAQPTLDLPRVEITLSPSGSTSFASREGAPEFTNYRFGIGLAVNLTRVLGVEGEFGGSFGSEQSMMIPTPDPHPGHHLPASMRVAKSPTVLDYNLDVIVSIPTGTGFIPYFAAGGGAVSLLERTDVSLDTTETLLTGNVGAGLKWLSASRRWGLRGDYRLIGVEGSDNSSPFFGRKARYAHRFYGAAIIGVGR